MLYGCSTQRSSGEIIRDGSWIHGNFPGKHIQSYGTEACCSTPETMATTKHPHCFSVKKAELDIVNMAFKKIIVICILHEKQHVHQVNLNWSSFFKCLFSAYSRLITNLCFCRPAKNINRKNHGARFLLVNGQRHRKIKKKKFMQDLLQELSNWCVSVEFYCMWPPSTECCFQPASALCLIIFLAFLRVWNSPMAGASRPHQSKKLALNFLTVSNLPDVYNFVCQLYVLS